MLGFGIAYLPSIYLSVRIFLRAPTSKYFQLLAKKVRLKLVS